MRTHYAVNRAKMRELAVKKFMAKRAAKESKRIEAAKAEPVLPDTSHVRVPRRPAADATILIRLADGRRFVTRVHRHPAGGLLPSKTSILREVGTTLALL